MRYTKLLPDGTFAVVVNTAYKVFAVLYNHAGHGKMVLARDSYPGNTAVEDALVAIEKKGQICTPVKNVAGGLSRKKPLKRRLMKDAPSVAV